MWPWGHATVGYLVFALVSLSRRKRLPVRSEAVAVIIGTQMPDLIDKPLAWYFGILPTGRSLGHSLLTGTVVIAFAVVLFRYVGRDELSVPFGLGYVLHLLTDLPASVLSGDFSRATFLLWPILPSPVYEIEPTFGAHFRTLEATPANVGQVLLLLVVLFLTVSDRFAESSEEAE